MKTFKKEERLYEKKIISELFKKGNIFYLPSFKVLWMPAEFESRYPVKIMISVPSRNFKKAVDRNKLKRIFREAYRQNKYILYDNLTNSPKKIAFMLLYTEKKIISFKEAEDKIILILQRLANDNEESF